MILQPVDFKKLALSIAQGGATDDYTVPLGYGTVSIDDPGAYTDAKYPKYPGDPAYENGPMVLKFFGEDLSQELIDIENKSFRDAIKHYMPIESVARHQCAFFQGDFLSTSVYQDMLTKHLSHLPTRKVAAIRKLRGESECPDESLSMNFGDASRKSRAREYFTLKEIGICEKVLKSRPEIYQSVFALQAGFLDYLDKLKDAFLETADISEPQQQRAVQTIEHMSQLWNTPNFAREIVPAICLAYYQRTGSAKADVTPDDFHKGYELGIRLGLFQHHVKSPVGDNIERHFNCPARIAIGAVIARDDQHLEGRPSHTGAMLAMIHGRLKPTAKPAACPPHHDKI